MTNVSGLNVVSWGWTTSDITFDFKQLIVWHLHAIVIIKKKDADTGSMANNFNS